MNCKTMVALAAFFPLIPLICLADVPATKPSTQPAPYIPSEIRPWTFEVRAVAPALPALRYELTVDPMDQEQGDAASLYFQAELLAPQDVNDRTFDNAWVAHHAGKSLASDQALTDHFHAARQAFDLLQRAARREYCDWNIPARALGNHAQFPQWNGMRNLAGNLLVCRGYQQIDAGKIDDAIEIIRIDYSMARHAAEQSPLVGHLVGLGLVNLGNELIAELMTRPDSPNLYWPLVNLPKPSVKEAMDGEWQNLGFQIPVLAKAKHRQIAAEDWETFVHQWLALESQFKEWKYAGPISSIAGYQSPAFVAMTLPKALKYYADTRHITLEQASKIDTKLVLATYFIEQFEIINDEQRKLAGLPMSEMLRRSATVWEQLNKLGIEDHDPAAIETFHMYKMALEFGYEYRQVAALTAIEALRAYAADHSGKLPAKLEDVAETPVPLNPMTGKSFDYHVDGNTAVLSDEISAGSKGYPLVYTLRILGK